jgi:hypothetical protein
MARTSSSSSMGNWKMKTTTAMCSGKGTTPPRKRTTMTSRPRKTRWQEVSCAPGHPMKMLMETTAGTLTTESTATMAPPATLVPKMTAATIAAVMMMAMSVRFFQSSAASSQAPTGGRLASMYQADRLALGAIGPSLVMTPSFFMNEISL